MGEFAMYAGSRVKLGTNENMFYLRWDQRANVEHSEIPLFDKATLAEIRFRFPWPDEDEIEPGGFRDSDRGFALYDFQMPDIDHGKTQFKADAGYLVMLPCPESGGERPYTIGRNGWPGPAKLVQQAWRGGRLVGIARCQGCGELFRLEEGFEEAAAVAIRSAADREIRTADLNAQRGHPTEGDRLNGQRMHEIADRLLAGYTTTTIT
jgi:hypothetical protein